ncbi:hypothetical protein L9F63_019290, partial [Diploptera punctata]
MMPVMPNNTAIPIQVAVRIRPLETTDRLDEIPCVQPLPWYGEVVVGNQEFFSVNCAYPLNFAQSQVFTTSVNPLINRVLEGYDISLIACGESGTGKTYTVLGPGLHCALSEIEYGMIPRATREIFSRLAQVPGRRFKITVSFIEIYQEEIRDLLNTNHFKKELMVAENEEDTVCIIGVEEVVCKSVSEVFNCVHVGMSNRHIGWASAHCSHSVFTLTLEQQWCEDGVVQHVCAKARFVDLAGRFMADVNAADSGMTSLENIVNVLSEPGYQRVVPYTQSTLTRILKNSIGGKAITLVIGFVSQAYADMEKSLNTLRFVTKFLRIHNKPETSLFIEKNEEQNTDIVDSEERSNADTFGLEFAASQWSKLVGNAENLLKKLVISKTLSQDERDQIERWLCLKQECEECVGSDEASVKGFEGRALERIDEITESEEKSGSSLKINPENEEEKSANESESESEQGSHRPDFLEKLDDLIKKFKSTTDGTIKIKRGVNAGKTESNSTGDEEDDVESRPPMKVEDRVTQRRKSIHPGSCLTLALNNTALKGTESVPVDVDENKNIDNEPYEELQLLSAGTEARQSQIRQVLIDLDFANKRIEELQYTIQIKEQFIADMIKNSEMRASAKQKFQRKRSKLEEEYYKMRTHLAHAENALLETSEISDAANEKVKHKKQVEKYKNLAMHYEKKLNDLEMIKQIAGDSVRKVLELENSLHSSKRQMEKLRKQLKKEEQHKQCLEQELLEDQRKIKQLEQKYNLHASKKNEKEGDDERLRWIQEEEERITSMRESSQRLQEQLLQQQTMLEKREAFLKEKLCLEKSKTKSRRGMSARILHLEQVLKEKSMDMEKTDDLDVKEALRHEISSLRKTRDWLLEERSCLDEKFQKDKKLSTMEERKLLECEEAVEIIDAVIEYKNELICGRKGQDLNSSNVQGGKGEKLLLERLMKLSDEEMRIVILKYFQKVIDYRESGRKMEIQLTDLELQTEAQAWKIQALINALQQTHFEAERRIVVLQKEHQEKLHVMLRHFAEESSASSGAERLLDRGEEVAKLKRENKSMKKRLQELEALMKTDAR